jgi:hypothetical protein
VFGFLYVGLATPAFVLGLDHAHAGSVLFAGATFAFLWFLASLRSRLIRYDPDGFFASVVVLGGAASIALQTVILVSGSTELAAPAAACAATVIVGSSLAAIRARKVPKWFGRAGLAGGASVLGVGLAEGAAGWTLVGRTVFASTLGFMIWVVVTTIYLLRRSTGPRP